MVRAEVRVCQLCCFGVALQCGVKPPQVLLLDTRVVVRDSQNCDLVRQICDSGARSARAAHRGDHLLEQLLLE